MDKPHMSPPSAGRHSTDPTLPHGLIWRILVALIEWAVPLMNDRFLPNSHQIRSEAVIQWLQDRWIWCQRYLADRDPGPLQFRGMPMSRVVAPVPVAVRQQTISYRGCVVPVQVADPKVIAASLKPTTPFQPAYQRRLKTWFMNLGVADLDQLPTSPDLDRIYRGQTF